jgi:hypothetical protein
LTILRHKLAKIGWPLLTLLIASPFYLWLSWRHIPLILFDQGWFLQVSRRVASGEILYRDVLWPYGPLPVLAMSWMMRLGKEDILYFSLMYFLAACIVTLAVYRLHRFRLSPPAAAAATWFVMIVCAGSLFFLIAYTPGLAIGAACCILALLGLLEAFAKPPSLLASILIGLGLAGSLLSKQEFAFAASVLCLLLLALSLRDGGSPMHRDGPARTILTGMLAGVTLASIVYAFVGASSGWSELFTALAGYRLIQTRGLEGQYYDGIRTLARLLAAMLLVVVALAAASAFVHWLQGSRKQRYRMLIPLALGGLYLLGTLSWQSGWAHEVILGNISVWDVRSWLGRTLAALSAYADFEISQIGIALGLTAWLLFVLLLTRWTKRLWRRAPIRFEQVACLGIVGFMVLGGLRDSVLGLRPIAVPVVVVLFTFLPSEFPSLAWMPRRVSWSASALGGALLMLAYSPGLNSGAWAVTSPLASPYGQAFVYESDAAFLSQALAYIDTNSQQDDYIVAIGPLPGLYYLSRRRDPLPIDYLMPGLGDDEASVNDYLSRLDRFRPAIAFVLEGAWDSNILQISPYLTKRPGTRMLFGTASSRVEEYLLEHYRIDREFSLPPSYRLVALKRAR